AVARATNATYAHHEIGIPLPAFGTAQQPRPIGDGHAGAYSITSSARASIDCGTVRPRALAVLRLMTSSKVVACWTGISAGLAPLRIFPAQIPTTRKAVVRLGP